MGNLKDATLEKLADKGNGNYAYIDSPKEAEKVLVEEMSRHARDHRQGREDPGRVQPAQVGAYRLIGYENRLLQKEDFNDDKQGRRRDRRRAQRHGALRNRPRRASRAGLPGVDPLKYQQAEGSKTNSDECLTVKLRYKQPEGEKSQLLERGVTDKGTEYARASDDFKFAGAVAGFGMLLRGSPDKGSLTYAGVHELAASAIGQDSLGYRAEFLGLVKKAQQSLTLTESIDAIRPVPPRRGGTGPRKARRCGRLEDTLFLPNSNTPVIYNPFYFTSSGLPNQLAPRSPARDSISRGVALAARAPVENVFCRWARPTIFVFSVG